MDETLILGLGGAGCEIAAHLQRALGGRAVAVGTDQTALSQADLSERLLIGPKLCQGYSALRVERGKQAAEESREELRGLLAGAQTLVLAAGLGGGTGTGAAPVIARLALEMGIRVIAVVTLPFTFETGRRGRALMGLSELLRTEVELLVYDHNEAMHGANESLMSALSRASDELAAKLLAHLRKIHE